MKRDHATKSGPRTSPVMDSRNCVTCHAGVKSVGTHGEKPGRKGPHHPIDVLNKSNTPKGYADVLPGSPGSGAAPGANGPPTTGGIGPGGPLGSF
jgi:hypothetical protein